MLHALHHLTLIYKPLVKSSDFPSLAQTAALALLTVLIPFIIAVFVEIQGKRNSDNPHYAELDVRVVLYGIFKLPYKFLSYLALTFLPLLYWSKSNEALRCVELALWAIGIIGLISIFFALFKWSLAEKNKYRIKQLHKLRKAPDIVLTWKSIWSDKNHPLFEADVFMEYGVLMERLIRKGPRRIKEFKSITFPLTYDFKKYLDEYADIELLIVRGKALEKLLKWQFDTWSKAEEKDKKSTEWSEYYGLHSYLNGILGMLYRKLTEQKLTYLLFPELKKHFDSVNNEKYQVQALLDIENTIFENSNYDFWRDFPSEWKVTDENLAKSNPVSLFLFERYINWVASELTGRDIATNQKLAIVSEGLFPELDVHDLLLLVKMIMQPFIENERMKSIITGDWPYTQTFRAYTSTAELLADEKIRKDKTLQFALKYLNLLKVYSPETVKEYRSQLRKLTFTAGSKEANHKKIIQKMLTRILALESKKT